MPLSKTIIITGVTTAGHTFRPSDWAERMSGSLASFNNQSLRYSPLLQPSVNTQGNKCMLIDPALKTSSPEIYQDLMDFVKRNNLTICGAEEE